ncbi:XRE family transcriptional regulator [Bizionia argentinensis JUB59]|uniref:XRE family transcriptional regulator n=1 Tax=Bizionia argentinensis JUB59 TaxID=1046627 RepID=A0A4U8UH83_9FLAO|nr:XRE family transcriptional regulator [Bizionia argentinensis JUB59]
MGIDESIKKIRLKNNLFQEDLADKLFISQATLSNIEASKICSRCYLTATNCRCFRSNLQ